MPGRYKRLVLRFIRGEIQMIWILIVIDVMRAWRMVMEDGLMCVVIGLRPSIEDWPMRAMVVGLNAGIERLILISGVSIRDS